MSCAVSSVLKCPSAEPYLATQEATTASEAVRAWARPAAVRTSGLAAASVSFCLSLMHCSGSDSPTPRGSKPTRSNRSSSCWLSAPTRPAARFTPEPPGPPGLTSSEPIRWLWESLRARTTKMSALSPAGWS